MVVSAQQHHYYGQDAAIAPDPCTAISIPTVGYVFANPLVFGDDGERLRDMPPLPNKERDLITRILRESRRQIRFRAVTATVENLRKLLNSGCPVLHYAGHANRDFLAFESSNPLHCGMVKPLSVKQLPSLLRAGGTSVRTKLVVICSCSSQLSGKAFVEAGVRHVVAVKTGQSVSDHAAQQFSDVFYDALIKNSETHTVRMAFETALTTVNASAFNAPLDRGNHFLLLPEDGDHDVRIFGTLPEGEFIDETPVLPPRPKCNRPVPTYKGLVDLQKVVRTLVQPEVPCVTIVGEHGSGKTERAIQALQYVRERGFFESYLWADGKAIVKKARADLGASALDWPWDSVILCRMIGLAVGMAAPGPSSEHTLLDFLFKNPFHEEGEPCKKVLLVLDNAHSLCEGENGSKHLVKLLSELCSRRGDLKVLVTSERQLVRDTKARFRSGSEVYVPVKPLGREDAAKFLLEMQPRPFTKNELGIPASSVGSRDEQVEAILRHPILMEVIEEAGGHPMTLARVAPEVQGQLGNGNVLKSMTAGYRCEYRNKSLQRSRHRRSISNTSGSCSPQSTARAGRSPWGAALSTPPHDTIAGLSVSFDTSLLQRDGSGESFLGRGRSATTAALAGGSGCLLFQPSLHQHVAGATATTTTTTEGACGAYHGAAAAPAALCGQRSVRCNRRFSFHEPQISSDDQERLARAALSQPEPPYMNVRERRAWDAAIEAGVLDLACLLVWVIATSDAWEVDRWAFGTAAGDGGGGSVARHRHAPWEYVKDALMHHLTGRLMVPSSNDSILLDGGGEGEEEEWGEESNAWYEAMDTTEEIVLDEDELEFIRGFLKSKEPKAGEANGSAGAHGRDPVEGRGALSSGGGGGGGDSRGDGAADDDVISLEAFAKFSHWWAPVVPMLLRLRKSWTNARPVRLRGRMAAVALLKRKEPGTFLLRFSERIRGQLVVSCAVSTPPSRKFNDVKHCLVEVSKEGCRIKGTSGNKCYVPLHDLIRGVPSFKTLYNNVPKEEAFRETNPPRTEVMQGSAREGTRQQPGVVATQEFPTLQSAAKVLDEGIGASVIRDLSPTSKADIEGRLAQERGEERWRGGASGQSEADARDGQESEEEEVVVVDEGYEEEADEEEGKAVGEEEKEEEDEDEEK